MRKPEGDNPYYNLGKDYIWENVESYLLNEIVVEGEEEGIPNPRLQMDKMIRRGILYVHLDKVHVNT